MGFYGNVTNTSKTNFSFDKIYPNRYEMEKQKGIDGIFVGRYVLIEYDSGTTQDSFGRVYGPEEGTGLFYVSSTFDEANVLKSSDSYAVEPQDNYIKKDMIVYTLYNGQYQYWKCTGEKDTIHHYAQLEEIDSNVPGVTDTYLRNYNTDLNWYNSSRGYDGTVWVKTSIIDSNTNRAKIEYVNIAELNSVVPTFAVSVDAPTMSPITPHFDTDSTNVYYKLHIQPQWGLRVGKAESSDVSDENTVWSREVYDAATNRTWKEYATGIDNNGITIWTKEEDLNGAIPMLDAAIFFNEAGFSPDVPKEVEGDNYIHIDPTGKSGNKYNLHDGTAAQAVAVDTQEISVNLPGIGNMMSHAWDIIKGEKRDDSTADSLQGRLDFFRNEIAHNEIPVQSSVSEGYLVGSVINGSTSYENSEIYDDNILNVEPKQSHLYDDPWIATSIDTNEGKDGNNDYHRKAISIHHTFHPRSDSDIEILDINEYDGKPQDEQGSEADSDTGFQKIIDKDTIQLYVPKVDKTGHIVGTDIDQIVLPYGYKHIKTIGNKTSNTTTDLDTVQDKLSNDKGTLTAGTPIGATDIVANETQDTVNIDPFNKWIQIKANNDKVEIAHEIHGIITKDKPLTDLNDGTDSITIQDITFDAAGHVETNQKHEYELPYGFKYFTTNGKAAESDINDIYTTVNNGNVTTTKKDVNNNQKTSEANNTQDTLNIKVGNKWIQTELKNNANKSDELVIAHEIHAINTTTATGTNLNGGNATNIASDNIIIPDLVFDKAGHLIENHSHKYTLPYGFKTVTVSNSTSATAAAPNSTTATSEIADNTQDTLQLSATNKWIKMKATGSDNIQFGHELSTSDIQSKATAGTYHASSDTNVANFGDSFNILKFKTDEAGHITTVAEDTVTIPAIAFTNDTTGNVVTNMAYSYNTNDKKGTFTETRENVGNLTLTDYIAGTTGALSITSQNSINSAFQAIQTYINTLDLSTSFEEDTVVSDVKQDDGKISIGRVGTNALKLKGYSASGQGTGLVNDGDVINIALAKLQNQIVDEVSKREKAFNTLYYGKEEGTLDIAQTFDTIVEIANWLDNNPATGDNGGIEQIFEAIGNNTNAITAEANTARANEQQIATSVATETTRAQNAETALSSAITSEASTARAAEQTLNTNITNEITRAKQEEQKIALAISEETKRATNNEAELLARIEELETWKENANQDIITLNDTINALITRIELLEEKHKEAVEEPQS